MFFSYWPKRIVHKPHKAILVVVLDHPILNVKRIRNEGDDFCVARVEHPHQFILCRQGEGGYRK